MSKIYWDKIRILVTNRCNYACPFCHNEGQKKGKSYTDMPYSSLKQIIDYIEDQGLSEICFSGGEPFLNESILSMIRYAEDNTPCDISCASNFSLITPMQIKQLQGSRVKFNIQFPYANNEDFKRSSRIGDFDHILKNIDIARNSGIKIGLNSVIQEIDTLKLEELISFSIKNELPLKLLPQIGLKDSHSFKDIVYPILKKHAIGYYDKGTGATRWTLKARGLSTTVLYIDSPCFTKDTAICRRYSEIRIHPNMDIQSCILKDPVDTLQLSNGKEYVLEQFRKSWKNLNRC